MAIVGTAFVRLRVIGDKLKGDIASATKKAVNDTAPELTKAGEDAGSKVGDGLTKGTETEAKKGLGKVADDIGNALGTRMGEVMGKSLRRHVGDGIRNAITSGKTEVAKAKDFFKPVSDQIEAFSKKTKKRFEGIFKNALFAGIAVLVAAAPSILAFLGAALGGLASTAVTALASIGPAIAGAALAGVAAFASLKISAGLFGLAMKTQSDQLVAFKKNLTGLKDSVGFQVQIGLLGGLNSAIRTTQRALPAISSQLRLTGQAGGDVAKNFARVFTSGAMLARIRTILLNNVSAIYGFGSGATQLAQAFVILLSHLGPLIDYLSTGADELGRWVLTMISGAEASGRLDSFISRMFDNTVRFAGGLVDFAKGIINIFRAAFGASGGMIDTFTRTGAAFKNWTGSPAGQARMIAFFEKMRAVTAALLPVFQKIGAAVLHGLESTHVDKFGKSVQTLTGFGAPLAKVFKDIQANAGPKLQQAFNNLLIVIEKLSTSGVLGTTVGAFANLLSVLAKLISLPGFPQLLAFLGSMAVILKTISLVVGVIMPIFEAFGVVLSVLGTILEFLIATFGVVAVGIGSIVAVVLAVVAALVYFFGFTKTGRAIVAAVWNFILKMIMGAVDGIVAAFHWLVDAFKVAVTWVVQLAQTIWSAVSTAFNAVVGAVTTALNAVLGVITTVWNAIWGFIQPILQGIWNVITSVFSGIVTAIQWYLNLLYQIWIRVWPILALPIRILYGVILLIWGYISQGISIAVDWIVSKVTSAWNWLVGITTTIFNAVLGVVIAVWSAISSWVSGVVSAIVGWIVARWNSLVGGISAALSAVAGVIVGVWNAIWGFLQPILSGISSFIAGVWNGVVGKVRSALNTVSGVISSIWNGIIGFLSGAMTQISKLVGGAWNMLGNAGTAVLSGLKSAVNTVVDAINSVIGGINWAIDTANKLPGPDIPKIPKIPHLAKGGVVSPRGGGTLAMIAEAGRPERVEPLDPNGLSQRDHAMINLLTSGGSGGQAPNVNVYIGTRELTDLVDFRVENRETSLASKILTGTKS